MESFRSQDLPVGEKETKMYQNFILFSLFSKGITGETQYNEILGTNKFCLLYIRYFFISVVYKQYKTKQVKLFHWVRGKQFVLSYLLYRVSTVFSYRFYCFQHI